MRILMKSKASISLKEGFKEVLQFSVVKNLSKATLKNYRKNYEYFEKFYGSERLLSEINDNTIRDYIIFLKENFQLQSIESVNTCLRYLRAMVNYWIELGYVKRVKIRMLKGDVKIKDAYTDDELKILLKKPNIKKCSFPEYRTWVVINFFVGTGCRVRTLVNIKIQDIDLDNAVIKYSVTKNRKHQIVPISKTLIKILDEYLKYRKGTQEDYAFCSETGTKLLETSVSHSVAKYNRKRGVSKTSVHLFRHTFAKGWILAGGDIFRLQKILGHSSIEIVKEYVNMFTDDLKQNFDQYNPLEKVTTDKKTIKIK
ncbi:tyrosine recombinase XerD [Desulfosporosinus acididurans]|uniref:Tyrosine recombinase XerD n=1 Tax=Desulfosporosinus acididurans TaxID=476652 RepID=A0A0J1ISB2_9FIRM|nr:tyrosine-type recombinase/integrase [Desulfosporosinus acididurans]KLU67546.1 tyrosine recombinase XerD [Desulfosporosinus acididurans]